MRKLGLLAVAAALYVLAAWMVAPGFYDGLGPPQPYNFTCPPSQAGANQKPSSGHVVIPVNGGVSEPDSAFTDDGQVVIGFLPGAFDATGKTSITVDITPLSTCPQPAGNRFVTNVYDVTADAKLVKPSNMDIRYSNLEPDPSDIYQASDPAGPWKSLGRNQVAAPYVASVSITSFGYFGAGYPASGSNSGNPTVGGGQLLPIIVAGLIVLVVIAGIPLALIRRRERGEPEPDDEAR
ncbi:MAG TPA: hypothetical protein VJT78_03250 [Candidatus Dormibacteraeota bacterium]|nr:hypothetical protein [Candidatus Dormibacteraeota bacterium]